MTPPLIVQNKISITAPAEKVWDVLTNPEQTKKYMFGCEAISEWTLGSPLVWKGELEGKEAIFVKGAVIGIDQNKSLEYTVIDPNSDMPDTPENYLNVTYQLEGSGGITELTVTQSGFEHAANGQKRYEETYNNGEGWNPILVQIKKIAEETN